MKKVLSFEAIDPTAAQRARVDNEYVEELVTCYLSQTELPPLDVFHIKGGESYWLADGLNRMSAAKKAGLKGIECVIHEGEYEDALLFSADANNRHGLRPTAADRRKKVEMLLQTKRWKSKSDRWIGDTVGVAHSTVGVIRRALVESTTANGDGEDKRERRDGKTFKAKKKGGKATGEGEPQFDFKGFYTAYGQLIRFVDSMYRIHKLVNANDSIRQDAEWEGIVKTLNKFLEEFGARWAYLHGTPFPKQ